VAAHAAQHPRKAWVVGVGWDQSAWGRYPTREDLDAAVPDRPVVLYRACWHVVVANSCALRAAGLSFDHKLEGEGEGEGIDVDAEGLPTGVLRETAVMRVTGHMVETDEAVLEGYYRGALARCLRAGITAVQTNDSKAWGLYQRLAAEGEETCGGVVARVVCVVLCAIIDTGVRVF
jgi:predicted amidohydrolase YtcJ